jgi:hypothetical protein
MGSSSTKSPLSTVSNNNLLVAELPATTFSRDTQPPPSPAFSVGSTFLSNAQAATAVSAARPVLIMNNSGSNKSARSNATSPSSPAASSITVKSPLSPQNKTKSPTSPTAVPTSAVDGGILDAFPQPNSAQPNNIKKQTVTVRESAVTVIDDAPMSPSPFQDAHEISGQKSRQSTQSNHTTMTRNTMMSSFSRASIPMFMIDEEAHSPSSPNAIPPVPMLPEARTESPFGDENEVIEK